MDTDDLEPRRPETGPKNLAPMSIEELEEYIVELEAEIGRVKEEVARKEKVRDGAEAAFKD